MSKFRKFFVVTVLAVAVLASALSAQDSATADLLLEVVQGPPSHTPPGSTGTLLLRITNLGPELAGPTPGGQTHLRILSSAIPFWEYIGGAVFFTRIPGGDCTQVLWTVPSPPPGELLTVDFRADFEELPPGESVVCEMSYEVNPALEVDFFSDRVGDEVVVTWGAGGIFIDDPDPENSQTTTIFRLLPPPPIPTLDAYGLLSLTLGLLLAFIYVRRVAASHARRRPTFSSVAEPRERR